MSENYDKAMDTKVIFREYYLKIKSTVTEHQLKEFGALKSDEERITFISKIISSDDLPIIETEGNGKDEKRAKELKVLGNKAFSKSDYRAALQFYTEAIIITPQDTDTTEFALTVANRSAVLHHLQEYQLAITDIDVALSLNYPKELRYKVLERKAKCHLALKLNKEAVLAFQNAIQALDECKLPAEKRIKMQTDIQIMLKVMTKQGLESEASNSLLKISMASKRNGSEAKLSSARNPVYEAACDKVDFIEDSSAGRFASAALDISAGETILIEKAYCSVLLAEYAKTNCQQCFKRTLAPYPCKTCSTVVFCSLECRESAMQTFHKYECRLLKTLHQSGVSVTVLMALRILTQHNLEYFLEFQNKLSEVRREIKEYKSSDYLGVYHLVRHQNLRERDDFFERSVIALFLLHCLIKVNYFKGFSTELVLELTSEEQFIGGLLLRHLQILQFNAHEISELEMKNENSLDDSKSVFIGGGLFVTLALFNHSCDPGIVRYFDGTKIIVQTVKPIAKGKMIAENYGPIYSQMRKKERQEKLQMQYWFKCTCVPCEELWPTFDEMDKNIMRFRCDSKQREGQLGKNCKNVLCVPVNTEEFMIKCFICGEFTNLFKGLKVLQETEIMYKQASKDLRRGDYRAALEVYLKILTTLHDTLAPPFRDYLLCQQSIRKCMLTFGNKYIGQV